MITALLKKITSALESRKIPYMLSGSLALNVYTIPRMSYDIDIVIELHEENQSEFMKIFGNDFYINPDTVQEETKRHGMFNAIDFVSGFKIDFIVRKESDFRKCEFDRRKKEKITDFEVWIVSPEDLIISKIEWIQKIYSDKQINDIENLLTVPDIDMKYIKDWCKILNLQTFELF